MWLHLFHVSMAGLFLLHCVQGVPSLSVNDVQLANTSSGLCIATAAVNYHPDQQLLCHSSVVEASYVWYYCYGDSTPAVVANGTASFTLDPTSPLEGVYSCVVPEDGAASVFICMHERVDDELCHPHFGAETVCNDTSSSESGSCAETVVTVEDVCNAEWKVVCVVTGSVVLTLLLLIVLVLVAICVYRKCRGGRCHQTEDYGVVENMEIDTFHSIPYRRDGLPECPINLYNNDIDNESKGKRGRSRITWPPSDKRGSRRGSSSPNMTWYYSAGKPLPVVPCSSSPYDEVTAGDEEDYHLLVDRYESTRGSGESRGHRKGWCTSVDVQQFEEAVSSKYQDGMFGFQREFVSLYSGSERNAAVAQRRENKSKNCFSNFYPYDDRRVILQSTPAYGNLDTDGHNDYINASYIDGFSKPNKFIATQVPLPHTVVDFWQMVWQEKASCIVLLSLNREEGRGMSGERYYSDGLGTWCIGPFLVTTTHRTQCPHHTIRYISVQVSGSAPLEVCQLQITHLSRQGVRHMAPTMLAFHRRFRELTSNSTQPTVVHCSTGVGLTGVFLAVDHVVEAVEEQGSVDVWSAVNSLRQQRPRMVPTMEQYMLIHEMVLEWVRWGNTEIPVCQLTTASVDSGWHTGEEEGEREEEGAVGNILEKLFQAVGPIKSVSDQSQGQPTSYAHQLWITHTAPGMQSQGSTVPYHRPTDVTGYWQGSGVLVTHSPTPSSAAQLWRTMLDKRCTTIIAFSQCDKESYQYWPDGNSPTFTAGQYSVQVMNGEEVEDIETMAGVGMKALRVEHAMSGQSHTVSQFHVVDCTGDLSLQLCVAVEILLKEQNISTHTAPALIHCSDGVSVCGVVCVVMMAVEQGLAEGLVDIPCAVRRVRAQLPAAISSMDQMKLVVKTVTNVLNRKLR